MRVLRGIRRMDKTASETIFSSSAASSKLIVRLLLNNGQNLIQNSKVLHMSSSISVLNAADPTHVGRTLCKDIKGVGFK